MATTNNRSWKALLPRNGGIGVCPQIGRVKIPPVCPRSTLNLTGGRRIKTVRACWFEGDEARFVSPHAVDRSDPQGIGLVEGRRDGRIHRTSPANGMICLGRTTTSSSSPTWTSSDRKALETCPKIKYGWVRLRAQCKTNPILECHLFWAFRASKNSDRNCAIER